MFSTGSGIGMLGGGAALDAINFNYNGADCAWAVLFWITGPIVALLVIGFMITVREPKSVKVEYSKPVDILGAILLTIGVAGFLIGLTLGEQVEISYFPGLTKI